MNDPVNHADPSGEWLVRLISGVVGAAVFGTLANLAVRVVELFTPVSRGVRIGITAAFAGLGAIIGATLGPKFMAKHTPNLLKAINQIQQRSFNVRIVRPNNQNIFGIRISDTLIIMLHWPHGHRPHFHIQVDVKLGGKQWPIAHINISPKITNPNWIRGR